MGFMETLQQLQGGNDMGIDFNKRLLEEAMGVLSGKLKVQDLPQYQFIKQMMMQSQKSQMMEAMKAMSAKGVTGGPMATVMNDINENSIKGLLGTGQDIYKGMIGQGTQAGSTLMNDYNQMMQAFMQAVAARKARHQQNKQFKTKLWYDVGSKLFDTAKLAAAGGFGGGGAFGGAGAASNPFASMMSMMSSGGTNPWDIPMAGGWGGR